MKQTIMGHNPKLIKALVDAGIVPDNCRRIVIDIPCNDVVTLYYEILGDTRLLDIDFAKHLGPVVKNKTMTPQMEEVKDDDS